MSEQPHHRPLPTADVLPPPQSTGGFHPLPTYPPHGYQQYQQQWPGQQVQGQWGYGGWAPAPPPKKTGGAARLLLGLVAAGASLFFVLILVNAVASSTDTLPRDDMSHQPADPQRPNAEPVDPGDVAAVLEQNTLYSQGGLANGNCPAEELGDAATRDQSRFYESLMGCLNAEWSPRIEGAGYAYSEPGLVVFDSPVTTPCGSASPQDGRTLAFYCPGDSVLYTDVNQMRQFFGSIEVAYAILIGHEFGHHVQHETGILMAYDDVVYEDYGQRLILSRRVELQASCMSGLFLGAIAESFPIDDSRLSQLDQVSAAFGDEPGAPENQRDHGSGSSNRAWILTAYDDNDIAVCNTFSAPEDEVD